jgi:hypothetical protein
MLVYQRVNEPFPIKKKNVGSGPWLQTFLILPDLVKHPSGPLFFGRIDGY